MKKSTNHLLSLFASLSLFMCGQLSASPIVLGGDELLGTIFPATPASSNNATEQVRFLVHHYNLGATDGTNLGNNPADPQSEVYTLYRPTAAPGTLDFPVHETKVDTSNPVIDLGGITYQYVLFFQASNAWVYYIGNISGFNSIKWGGHPIPDPPSNWNGSTISHYSLFNGTTTTQVPDGAATLALLGLGLSLTAVAYRRKSA